MAASISLICANGAPGSIAGNRSMTINSVEKSRIKAMQKSFLGLVVKPLSMTRFVRKRRYQKGKAKIRVSVEASSNPAVRLSRLVKNAENKPEMVNSVVTIVKSMRKNMPHAVLVDLPDLLVLSMGSMLSSFMQKSGGGLRAAGDVRYIRQRNQVAVPTILVINLIVVQNLLQQQLFGQKYLTHLID